MADQRVAIESRQIARSLGLTPPEFQFAAGVAQWLFDGSLQEWRQYEQANEVTLRPACLPAAFRMGWVQADTQRKVIELREAERRGELPEGPEMAGHWFGPGGEPLPEPAEPGYENEPLFPHFLSRLNTTIGTMDEPIPGTDLWLKWAQTGPTASVAAFFRDGEVEVLAVMLTKSGQPAEDLRALEHARSLWGRELPDAARAVIEADSRPGAAGRPGVPAGRAVPWRALAWMVSNTLTAPLPSRSWKAV